MDTVKPSKESNEVELEEYGLGFDYVFKRVPTVSFYQVLLFIMSNWLFFCAGFTQVGSVILQAQMDHRCKTLVDVAYADDETFPGYEFMEFSPDGAGAECEKYDIDWTECSSFNSSSFENDLPQLRIFFDNYVKAGGQKEKCTFDLNDETSGRIFDQSQFSNTVISEWDLVCENNWVDPVLTAIFMSGLFFGVMIFGPLADKLGRVNTVEIAAICLIVAQLGTAFIPKSWTVWSYAIFRMLAGCFAIGGGTVGFVYIMEIIGTRWRTWFGVDSQMLFSIGYICLSFVGALCDDWRLMMIVFSAMPIFYVLIFFFLLPKSARFLFSAGRNEEAKKALLQIGKRFPKRNINEEFAKQVEYSTMLESNSDSSEDKVYTQADLFKDSGIRRITIFCMYQWFATTLVYYGLSLGAGNLGGDLLVNNLLNGLVEFICYIFLPAFIDIRCIGRKYGIIITMAIGVIGCYASAAFGEYVDPNISDDETDTMALCSTIFAIVGKFGVSGTFGVIYVHASELYPTPVRSIGVGIASAMGRVGGILAPLVANLGGFLPMIIFGSLGLLQVISTFWMPETLGIPMMATLEQAEAFYAGKSIDIDSQPVDVEAVKNDGLENKSYDDKSEKPNDIKTAEL